MAFNIHNSHRAIFLVPAIVYVILVILIAIIPAMNAERVDEAYAPPQMTNSERWGRELYRTVFNCVPCHTMQVRGDTRVPPDVYGRVPVLPADARFGLERPTTAAEFAHLEAPTIGTQRTGPDLTSVGVRLPGVQWHFWHLYDPRSVSPGSTMEAYPYLFTSTMPEAENGVDPIRVENIEDLGVESGELWATSRAVALVDYLLSLTRPEPEERDGQDGS